MLLQGKHAQTKLYTEQLRLLKTYIEPCYAENEYFALNFLAESGIMSLNPKKESPESISMDWIKKAKSPELETDNQLLTLTTGLAAYLKNLHKNSLKIHGFYLTHEDLFLDNLLICEKSGKLFLIDWGLSQKSNSVYPDAASVLLGALNDFPDYYEVFLEELTGNIEKTDFEAFKLQINSLYNKYKAIRKQNGIETSSLDLRLQNAFNIIEILSLKTSENSNELKI